MNKSMIAKLMQLMAGMLSCSALLSGPVQAEIDLSRIRMPDGFKITVFTDKVPGARSLSLGDDGTVYVGTLGQGKVFAVRDLDGNGQAEIVREIGSGLNYPNGVAWHEGDLYVAEVSRILRIRDIKAHLDTPAKPEVVFDGFPTDKHHGWKYLRVGPDNKLYTAVGAPCNVCLPEKAVYGSLVRMDTNGKNVEIIAQGLRNSVGFDWQPDTGDLWLTDNGRDWLGKDAPPDELNRLRTPGQHFGFPYCFGKDIADPEFGKLKACNEFTGPEWQFPAHVAALGAHFYRGAAFPPEYKNQLFVAQHGSWNRIPPQGYRIVVIRFENGRPLAEQSFAEGWLNAVGYATGRPVDVLPMPDGALLVSDDKTGALYRMSYTR